MWWPPWDRAGAEPGFLRSCLRACGGLGKDAVCLRGKPGGSQNKRLMKQHGPGDSSLSRLRPAGLIHPSERPARCAGSQAPARSRCSPQNNPKWHRELAPLLVAQSLAQSRLQVSWSLSPGKNCWFLFFFFSFLLHINILLSICFLRGKPFPHHREATPR